MLLSAEHLSINFGSRQLLDDVNFYLNEGDKVGVIGINGTGKSTFLKVLSGVTEPDGGTISRNPNVQVSLLPQNPAMEESATVLEQVFLHFPAEFRELNEYEAKAMLNRLGITDFAQKVGTLSGGQRKRVALAAALIHPADVLILDEPTNHLDSEMVAWLEDWLRRFKGGLVMVTHDRYFLDRTVSRIFAFNGGGKIRQSEGGYSDYLIRVELEKPKDGQTIAENMSDAASAQTGESDSKKTWKQREKKLKFSYKEQREYETIDDEIASLEEQLEKLEQDILKNATNSVKLSELVQQKEETQAALDEKMERWVYLSDLAEKIESQKNGQPV